MAHFNNTLQFAPLVVLGMSFLGSPHCIAMCGGLVTSVGRDRASILWYHSGRLIGYCTLGTIAGFIGEKLFSDGSAFVWLSWLSTGVISLGFIFFGIRLFQNRPVHINFLTQGGYSFLRKNLGILFGDGPRTFGIIVGMLSAFLPCGWLHTFVLASITAKSPLAGAFSLFLFWLGTLPALSFTPAAISQVLRPLQRKLPKLTGALLIAFGLMSIGLKVVPTLQVNRSEHSSCHH